MKVEEVTSSIPDDINVNKNSTLSPDEKLIVTDFADYPESFDLVVGSEKIRGMPKLKHSISSVLRKIS